MSEARRTSVTQMADFNYTLADQNQRLKNMHKVAQQTKGTTNNIQGELYRQRDVIQNNIDVNKDIKHQIHKADKKTNQMRRRQFCIKFVLWIVAILIFCADVGLIIWKAMTIN